MASRWFCSEPWIECLSVYHSWWWCTFQVYSILTRMVGQKGVPGANLSPLRALVGFTLTLALEGTAYFRSKRSRMPTGTKVTDPHRFGIYRLSCQVIPNSPAARLNVFGGWRPQRDETRRFLISLFSTGQRIQEVAQTQAAAHQWSRMEYTSSTDWWLSDLSNSHQDGSC